MDLLGKTLITCLCVAATMTATLLQAEEPPAAVDAQSEVILKKLAAALSGAQRLSMELDGKLWITAGPEIQHRGTSSSKIRLEKPNRFRVIGSIDNMRLNAVSDGNQLVLHSPVLKRYLKTAPPSLPISEASGTNLVAHMVGITTPDNDMVSMGLLTDAYRVMVKDVHSIRYIGKEDVNGQAAHRLTIIDPQHHMEMWISDSEKPVILKTKTQLKNVIERIRNKVPEGTKISAEMTTTYTNWTYSAELPPDSFSTNTPEGAKKTYSLNALLGLRDPAALGLIDKPAPDFKLELLDGSSFSLKEALKKDIIILEFWATWCVVCNQVMPELEALVKPYEDQGVRLIAVNLREDAAKIKPFLSTNNLEATVALDKTASVADRFLVQPLPQIVIIGKDGTIADVHVGYAPIFGAEIKRVLEHLIAEGN